MPLPDPQTANAVRALRQCGLSLPAWTTREQLADFICAASYSRQVSQWTLSLADEGYTLASQRAPKGGINIGGKQYRGGMYIPGAVIANATKDEKAELAEKKGEEPPGTAEGEKGKGKEKGKAGKQKKEKKAKKEKKPKPAKPTLDDVHAQILDFRTRWAAHDHPSEGELDGFATGLVTSFTKQQLMQLRDRLQVGGSGVKSELAGRMVRQAMMNRHRKPRVKDTTGGIVTPEAVKESATAEIQGVGKPPEPAAQPETTASPVPVPGEPAAPAAPAAKPKAGAAPAPTPPRLKRLPSAADEVPDVKERYRKIRKAEQSGGMPYIDAVIHALQHNSGKGKGLPSHAVFEDLRRQSRGEKPLNVEYSAQDLDTALKAVAPDHGTLTPMELTALLPSLSYQREDPSLSTEQVLAGRQLPLKALQRSGLAPQWWKPKEDRPVPGQAVKTEVPLMRESSVDLSPASLPDRLDRLQGREKTGGMPFIDAVIYSLKQGGAVGEDVSGKQVFDDLQRIATGKPPVAVDVDQESLGTALKRISMDFGSLSGTELLRILPHMSYPVSEGSQKVEELLAGRQLPEGSRWLITGETAPAKPTREEFESQTAEKHQRRKEESARQEKASAEEKRHKKEKAGADRQEMERQTRESARIIAAARARQKELDGAGKTLSTLGAQGRPMPPETLDALMLALDHVKGDAAGNLTDEDWGLLQEVVRTSEERNEVGR